MRTKSVTLEWRAVRRRPHLIAAEFVLDGTSLLEQIERATTRTFDLASPIGWAKEDYQIAYANRLLLLEQPILPSGRREILVCPEWGDLGCGCISADIQRAGDYIVWSELGYENDYDSDSLWLFPMGQLVFVEGDLAARLATLVPGVPSKRL